MIFQGIFSGIIIQKGKKRMEILLRIFCITLPLKFCVKNFPIFQNKFIILTFTISYKKNKLSIFINDVNLKAYNQI